MTKNYIALAAIMYVFSGTAIAQNNSIGVDVTPKAQVEQNKWNDRKTLEANRIAEAQAEQAERRATEQRQVEVARELARIQVQAEIEAARLRKPDVCLLCNWRK